VVVKEPTLHLRLQPRVEVPARTSKRVRLSATIPKFDAPVSEEEVDPWGDEAEKRILASIQAAVTTMTEVHGALPKGRDHRELRNQVRASFVKSSEVLSELGTWMVEVVRSANGERARPAAK
jgi:hypothetical protein